MSATLVQAQDPTIPEPPHTQFRSQFLEVTGQYGFSGCFTGVVVPMSPVLGTPACASGALTLGIAAHPFPSGGGQPTALIGSLDVAYHALPQLTGVRAAESTQFVTGTLTDATCPVGCQRTLTFSFLTSYHARDGQLSWSSWRTSEWFFDAGSTFVPHEIRAGVRYAVVENVPVGPMEATSTFALTAVPEPSTYALFATGLLGLAGVARRRRSA